MPQVSVIIPVWNGASYLAEAIESVLTQDFEDREVIVVNDGSTDGTPEVMAQFGTAIVQLHQENKGLGAARNAGIRASSGSYLAFLDHDDLWTGTKLSEQMRCAAASMDRDPLIFAYVEQFICPRLGAEARSRILLDKAVLPGHLAGTMLISRRRFESIGYFTEGKEVGEFLDWYMRALEKDAPMLLLDFVALLRRIHETNMGRRLERAEYLRILKAGLDRRRLKA